MVHYNMQTVLLDFNHHLNFKVIKLHHFGSWVLLLHSGKNGEKRTGSLSLEPPG
jgi:hypothetical protein